MSESMVVRKVFVLETKHPKNTQRKHLKKKKHQKKNKQNIQIFKNQEKHPTKKNKKTQTYATLNERKQYFRTISKTI